MTQLYIFMVCVGLFVVLSSTSFWMSWLGLELMTLFFLPILCKPRGWIASLATWQYLIVQTSGSSLFIVMLLMAPHSGLLVASLPTGSSLWGLLLMFPLLFKLSTPPFQTWALNLSDMMPWLPFFLLNGVQKVGPLCLLFMLANVHMTPFLTVLLFLTCMVCTLGVLENSLRRFLAYSSLLNVGWCLYLCPLSTPISISFILVYLAVLLGLIACLHSMNLFTVSSLYINSVSYTQAFRVSMAMAMLSTFGLPPFMGFQLKLEATLQTVNLLLPLTLVLFSTSIILLLIYLHLLQVSFVGAPANKVQVKLSSPKVMGYLSVSVFVSLSNLVLL